MNQNHLYTYSHDSNIALNVYVILNHLIFKECAKCSIDKMSCGFKFNDEYPSDHDMYDDETRLSLINILRVLWGYRSSLILGNPKTRLKDYWQSALKHAPNWPGFHHDRLNIKLHGMALKSQQESNALFKDIEKLFDSNH